MNHIKTVDIYLQAKNSHPGQGVKPQWEQCLDNLIWIEAGSLFDLALHNKRGATFFHAGDAEQDVSYCVAQKGLEGTFSPPNY